MEFIFDYLMLLVKGNVAISQSALKMAVKSASYGLFPNYFLINFAF